MPLSSAQYTHPPSPPSEQRGCNYRPPVTNWRVFFFHSFSPSHSALCCSLLFMLHSPAHHHCESVRQCRKTEIQNFEKWFMASVQRTLQLRDTSFRVWIFSTIQNTNWCAIVSTNVSTFDSKLSTWRLNKQKYLFFYPMERLKENLFVMEMGDKRQTVLEM